MKLPRKAFHAIEEAAETLDGVMVELSEAEIPPESASAVRRLLSVMAALESAVELIESEN